MSNETMTSDQKLAAELDELAKSGKKNFTLAEAQAAAGEAPGTPPATDEAKPKRRTRAAKPEGEAPKLSTPRIKIPAGAGPAQILMAHVPEDDARFAMTRLTKDDAADAENFQTVTGAIGKLAKKVGEKAINLLRHRSAPSSIQVYTRIALDKLIADGQLTSKGLTEHYQKTKYTIGTARAQCNQIMTLFPALKMTTVSEKGTMVLNKQSTIVRDYEKATNG